MKIFKKNYIDKEFSDFENDKLMAREIISNWGDKYCLYSCDSKVNGGYYNEYIYFEDGLELVYSELEGLFILYNDKKVLDHFEYTSGEWESILKRIYSKVLKVKFKDDDRSGYEKGIDALHLVDSIGNATINSSLLIIRDDLRLGYGDNKNITTYNVYNDDDLVFSGSYISPNREKVYVYEEGEWEQELRDYIKSLFMKREELKNDETKKYVLKK